jgi:hypothetical protein
VAWLTTEFTFFSIQFQNWMVIAVAILGLAIAYARISRL